MRDANAASPVAGAPGAGASDAKSGLVLQLEAVRRKRGLSKTALARRMGTSRAALNRLLDPDNGSLTLASLERAVSALGCSLRIEVRSGRARASGDRPGRHPNRRLR